MATQQSMSFPLLVVLLHLVVTSAGAGPAPAPGPGAPSSVITSTCSAVAKSATPATPEIYKNVYDDCVGLLSAYSETASAVDVRGVAIAAADLTAANVTSMQGFLQDLIGYLQDCLETYKDMGRWVAGGTEDLRAGRIGAAVTNLDFAESMPMRCLVPYVYAENPSPIDKEIRASIELATTAASITEVLNGTHP